MAEQKAPAQALPPDLQFLEDARCNPDLQDDHVRKIGCMRSEKNIQGAKRANHDSTCGLLRQIAKIIFYSFIVQTLVLLVIAFDCVLTIISFTPSYDESAVIYDVSDWLVVIVLSLDVLGRFFVEGWPFLQGKMNVFELFLVPLTIVEVFVLKDSNLPLPLLRVLRPLFRGVRIARVTLKALDKLDQKKHKLRLQLSGDRIRFQQDGFDLDLAYITPQIIAMPLPAVGKNTWLHNDQREVARFMNERHGGKYVVVNSAKEVRYPTEQFFHRVMSFPMALNGVPALDDMLRLCAALDAFLRADPEHVVAIHSKFAQGRTSLVIICFLMYRGVFKTPKSAIPFYEHARTAPSKRGTATTQTIDCASQARFLNYFAYVCRERLHSAALGVEPRVAKLISVKMNGIPTPHTIDVKLFSLGGQQLQLVNAMAAVNRSETEDLERGGRSPTSSVGGEDEDEAMYDQRAKQIVEQSTYDSMLFGTSAVQRGQPTLSSQALAGLQANMTFVPADKDQEALGCGSWDAFGAELRGGIRVELHRRPKGEAGKLPSTRPEDEEPKQSSGFACCGLGRKAHGSGSEEEKVRIFEGGLMLAAWLHTDHLECDEPVRDTATRRSRSENIVHVVLDRFALDKAAGAPALASHSPALKLELEFEVTQRSERRGIEDLEEIEKEFGSSSFEVGEPCSMTWLTWMFERIWPSFSSGFRSMFEATVSSLQETLPAPFNKICLKSFSLGEATPQFGPVVASSRTADGLEVQLDIGLDYITDTNIVLELSKDLGIAIGIRRLQIQGVLSVKFKPILPELPVFASVQLLFINPPKIDLVFGRSLEIANSSMVKSKIFGAINEGLADVMVLPNVLTINWADTKNLSDSAVSFENLAPCAIVRIGVLEARGLATPKSAFARKPNAFAKIKLGGQVAKTAVVNLSSNPIWANDFDFLIYDERQQFEIRVSDLGLTRMASKIGHAQRISVASLLSAGEEGVWTRLEDTPDFVASEVLLRATMFDLVADAKKIEATLSAASMDGAGTPAADHGHVDSRKSRKQESHDLEVEDEISHENGLMQISTEAEAMLPGVASEAEGHSGAVMLLVCQVHGGRLHASVAEPSTVSIEARMGKSHSSQACVEAAETDPYPLTLAAKKAIERLAASDVSAEDIAESLGEDLEQVRRIIRKSGWNLACAQKICVCASPGDLQGADDNVHVNLLVSKTRKVMATSKIPFAAILQNPNAKHSAVLTCVDGEGSALAELDLELRLFALTKQLPTSQSPVEIDF